MNARERFLAVMAFEKADRAPLWEFGYWGGAIRRWYEEGLPRKVGIPERHGYGEGVRGEGGPWSEDRAFAWDVHEYFGFDKGLRRIPSNNLLYPLFSEEVLEDHGDWVLMRDDQGLVRRERKDRGTLPHYASWPVAKRDDWEQIKAERLQPNLAGRLPANWPALVAEFKQRDYPLVIGGGYTGFFGTPRNLMGPENLLLSFYDDPALVKDMVNHLADFWVGLYGQILDQVDVDMAIIWEDMSYKTGPMISPAMFRAFLLPGYRKLTSYLKERGVRVIIVDTDGDCWKLMPLFVEGGVTGLYPFEVMAGMDVAAVRRAFPRLQMLGGIDKTKIAAGPAAIDEELGTKIPFVLRTGGYVPYMDHNVPPDISWDNFVYYRRRLEQMIQEAARE